MKYVKTQYGPWYFIPLIMAGACFYSMCFRRPFEWNIAFLSMLCFVFCIVFSLYSCCMTIRDEGEAISISFGCVLSRWGLFQYTHATIPYADIKSVESSRFSIFEGCYAHYIPFRGWSYRIWGSRCVKLIMHENKPIRLGSNDVENLISFLRSKISQTPSEV
jgi:hypothetical protein